jgi:acetyl esterase/lipase
MIQQIKSISEMPKMLRYLLPLFICVNIANGQSPKPVTKPQYPDDVRVKADIEYLPSGRTEKADLYFPLSPEPGKTYPAVVMIHGGGWTSGSKHAKRELNVCGNLARAGYIAMSIDYVLSDRKQVVWPQNLHDCQTAVRWLRKNAAELSVDAENIGVIGGSAGGHLAAMVTLLTQEDGLDAKDPYEEWTCRVKCGVDLYGPNDLTDYKDLNMIGKTREEAPELYRQASPISYARKNSPPMLIMHGTADTTVAVRQSELLAEALKKVGAHAELIVIPDAPHTFHLQPKQRDLRPVVIGFFDRHLKATN